MFVTGEGGACLSQCSEALCASVREMCLGVVVGWFLVIGSHSEHTVVDFGSHGLPDRFIDGF